MFQSITCLIKWAYNQRAKSYSFQYEIKDSDFVSTFKRKLTSTVRPAPLTLKRAAMIAGFPSLHGLTIVEVVVIKEYESRNYDHQEIVKNLFLLNIFMLKQNWYSNMSEVLEYQVLYLNKEDFPQISFYEKYYDDLVKYTNKMMIIS